MGNERCVNLSDGNPVDAVKEGMCLYLIDIQTLVRGRN